MKSTLAVRILNRDVITFDDVIPEKIDVSTRNVESGVDNLPILIKFSEYLYFGTIR